MFLKFREMNDHSRKMEDSVPLLPNPVMIRQRLGKFQKAAYGVGHVMNDVCAAIWFSYTLLFFNVVLEMRPVLAGSMLLIGSSYGFQTNKN